MIILFINKKSHFFASIQNSLASLTPNTGKSVMWLKPQMNVFGAASVAGDAFY